MTHPFSIGDRVRPTKEWRDAQTPSIPAGVVRRAEAFGRGQVLYVGDDSKPYAAGIFERDDGDVG